MVIKSNLYVFRYTWKKEGTSEEGTLATGANADVAYTVRIKNQSKNLLEGLIKVKIELTSTTANFKSNKGDPLPIQ